MALKKKHAMAEKAELVGDGVPPAPAKDAEQVQVISTDASKTAGLCTKNVLIGAGVGAGLLVLVVVIAVVVASGETCSPGWHSPDGGPCVENTCTTTGCFFIEHAYGSGVWFCPDGYVVEDASATSVAGLGRIMCEPDGCSNEYYTCNANTECATALQAYYCTTAGFGDECLAGAEACTSSALCASVIACQAAVRGYFPPKCAGLGATCDADGGAFTFTGCLRECLRQPLLPCSDISHACTARTHLWSQITCTAMLYAADRLCTDDAS